MADNLPAVAGTSEVMSNPVAAFADPVVHGQLYEAATRLSKAKMIPAQFQNSPDDCLVAIHTAIQMRADPLIIMQNLYVVGGKPGWNAAFAIAQANRSGYFKTPIQYRYKGEGESREVQAYAVLKATDTEVQAVATYNMAKLEGWTRNKKYQSMPDHMLSYRAAMFLIRKTCPEVLLGLPAVEELQDVAASVAEPSLALPASGTEALRGALAEPARVPGSDDDLSGPAWDDEDPGAPGEHG